MNQDMLDRLVEFYSATNNRLSELDNDGLTGVHTSDVLAALSNTLRRVCDMNEDEYIGFLAATRATELIERRMR